jgi:hypothetical protein
MIAVILTNAILFFETTSPEKAIFNGLLYILETKNY